MISRIQDKWEVKDKKKAQSLYMVYNIHQLFSIHLGSLFAATLLLFVLQNVSNHFMLNCWYATYFLLTIFLFIVAVIFHQKKNKDRYLLFWEYIYITSSIALAIMWGAIAFLFYPYLDPNQQNFCIFMLAGTSAGGSICSSPIPAASIGALLCIFFPFIISIFLAQQPFAIIFCLALSGYLLFLILLSLRVKKTLGNIIGLQFEKENLLEELSASNKALENLATHDQLTNVDNIFLFNYNFSHAKNRAKRDKNKLALFYIDIDNFKYINDNYGHNIGNKVLIEVAQRLTKNLRAADSLARIGGDEFIILAEKIHNNNEIISIAEKICHIISAPMLIQDNNISVTLSIGISVYPKDGESEDELLNKADTAMYFVKNQGKNSYHFY